MNSLRQSSPTMQIDGDKIKKLREKHGVTQLYIAEVTGVSVDTVSRWENNRSPAVKRENAEALASALEVDIADIIRYEVESVQDQDVDTEALVAQKNKTAYAFGLLVIAFIVSAAAWKLMAPPPFTVKTDRLLPAYTPPETEIPVVLKIKTSSGKGRRVIVREKIPPGWKFIGAVAAPDHGPTSEGIVKWILNLDEGLAQIAYLVKSPTLAEEGSPHHFTGTVVLGGKNGEETVIEGESRIDIEYVHWADIDADFKISDSEVLAALERLDAARGLELDPSAPRELWGTDGYVWDAAKKVFKSK